MLTPKLSVKKYTPKLPTKCCLQSYVSETLSCSSPVRSGSFFWGGRLSCRQGKWRKNNGSQRSYSSADSVVKIHAVDSSLLRLKQCTPHKQHIFPCHSPTSETYMKPGRDGRLLYYEIQQVYWNFFRYSNIRSLLMTYTFHKLIPTRLPNCWKLTQKYLKHYTWGERISLKEGENIFFP